MKWFAVLSLLTAICIIVALPLSVSAADISDVTGNIGFQTHFSIQYQGTNTGLLSTRSPLWYSPHSVIFDNLSYTYDGVEYIDIYITISSESDVYVAYPYAYSTDNFVGDWEFYHDSTGDFYDPAVAMYGVYGNIDFSLQWYDVTVADPGGRTGAFYFFKFSGMPAGTYQIHVPYNEFWFEFTEPVVGCAYGVWVTELNPGGGSGSYFDIWFDPNAPLDQQLDDITNTLKDAIDSTDLRDLKSFYTIFAQYQLSYALKVSDERFVISVRSFSDELDSIIADFRNQDIDYSTALSDMSDSFVEALQTAETPEQGNYITNVYGVKQQLMHEMALTQAQARLESAISDEEMDEADDYYNREEDLIGQFNMQQMEDLVDYQQWYNLLDAGEADLYKSIYDWFFNSSSFKFFIVVPITLSIITIIMGTRIKHPSAPAESKRVWYESDGQVWSMKKR